MTLCLCGQEELHDAWAVLDESGVWHRDEECGHDLPAGGEA